MTSYENKIIVATGRVTPQLFNKAVIYIHSDDSVGTIGIMLNMRMDETVAKNWAKEINWMYPDKMFIGGPVSQNFGYMLHGPDYAADDSLQLNSHLLYSNGGSVLHDINRGIGPLDFMLLAGYCSWQPNQLQDEIDTGNWIVTDFDEQYAFNTGTKSTIWNTAIKVAAGKVTQHIFDTIDT